MGGKKTTKTDEKQPSGNPSWSVRNENGEIFGPADLDTLAEWARDGRLAPTHDVSEDGKTWQTAGSVPVLEMDWISEISRGSFYGPIHQTALCELIAEKAIAPDSPKFFRYHGDMDVNPAQVEKDLLKRIEHIREEFNNRIDERNEEITRHKREKESLKADLKAKDLEFEAERRDLDAERARAKADIVKRDTLLEALKNEIRDLENARKGHHAEELQLRELENHLAELKERSTKEIKQLRRDHERQVGKLSQEIKDAKTRAKQSDADAAAIREEMEALQKEVRILRQRAISVKNLLEDALNLGNGGEPVIAAMTGEGKNAKPKTDRSENASPVVRSTPSESPPATLAAIEAQAQNEIRTLRNHSLAFNLSR